MPAPPDPREQWEQFKRDHPRGQWLKGKVIHRAQFGVFVDLGVPFTALLEIPYFAGPKRPLNYPDDYPAPGQEIDVMIRHYCDDVVPGSVGQIALTQDPSAHRIQTRS